MSIRHLSRTEDTEVKRTLPRPTDLRTQQTTNLPTVMLPCGVIKIPRRLTYFAVVVHWKECLILSVKRNPKQVPGRGSV